MTIQLHSVLLARSLAFIDIQRLDPKGRLFYPDLIAAIAADFSFQKVPKLTELDDKKGLEFQIGRSGEIVIDAMKIFDTLLVVETHSNTKEAQKVTEQMLLWAKSKFGLAYEPSMIRHWGFVSDVTFKTDSPLLAACCDAMAKVAAKTSKAASDIWAESIEYQPIIFTAGHNPLARKNALANFTIQVRAETRFEENIYFSEAPLPTDLHIKFLEEFAEDVLGK